METPFAGLPLGGLSLAEEAAAFERLKPRLATLWSQVFPRDDEPYTSVIVPSVSVDTDELARHPEARYYEEALLFLLIRLRNPRARVVFVTSQPIPGVVMEYYLHFLAGIPASHAAARLTLLSTFDTSARPLTAKILERPRLLQRIRAAIPNLERAYLTVLRSTPLERRLAVLLGIPLNAADPGMESLCTKSGGRRVLREAGIEVPAGCDDLRDETDILNALADLRAQRPALRRAILKLQESHWEEGHAVFEYPAADSPAAYRDALRRSVLSSPEQQVHAYLERFRQTGGVVEEFVEGVEGVASGQVRISPSGAVVLTSTHEEVRGGHRGLSSVGCRFPAEDRYRGALQQMSLRVGQVLAARGLVSRLSVEFLVCAGDRPRLCASEINLGVGGSTRPLLAVRFLSGGQLDPESGLFRSPAGRSLYYRATDRLESRAYQGLLPADLIEILTLNQLHYSPVTESGALFYMLGAVSELGRVGMVAIGESRENAEAVYRRTVATLDRECSASVPPARDA